MRIDYPMRPPDVAFDEMIDAMIYEGIPLEAARASPALRLLFYAGMVAANGTGAKQLRDFRGQFTELFGEHVREFHRQCINAMAKQSAEGIGYAINLDGMASPQGSRAVRETETGTRETRPDDDGDDRVLRRVPESSAGDRTGGADDRERARGGRTVLSQAGGFYRGAKSRTGEKSVGDSDDDGGGERLERELTGNVVVDYWIMSGSRLCPESERERSLGQLLEMAFYMGASFFGGQVTDTLSLDDVYVDEVTRETFAHLTGCAVSAMEAAGDIAAMGASDDDDND